jgi:hypothetical protein
MNSHAMRRMLGVDPAQIRQWLRSNPALPAPALDLDAPFLMLGGRDYLPLRAIFAHTIGFGRSGVGKTTTLLPLYLTAFVRWLFGMLICTFKSDDAERSAEILRWAGAESPLIVRPGGPLVTNLLASENPSPHDPQRVADLLMEAANNREEGGSRKESDPIWMGSTGHMIRLVAQALQAAAMPVHMRHIKACVDTIPTISPTGELLWPEDNAMLRTVLQRAQNNPDADPEKVQECLVYFTRELQRPGSARFVSSVLATFTNSFDFCLAPGLVRDTFFSDKPATFSMSDSRRGRCIILDIPESTFGAAGRDAQILAKAAWIARMTSTQGLPFPGARPVAFICDEYQRLCTPLDLKMFEAGRSSLVAALCLTQSVPNLARAFAASQAGEYAVNALLQGFANYICCQTHCPVTAQKLAEIAAKDITLRHSTGTTENDTWQEGSSSGSGSSGGASGGASGASSQSSWNSSSQVSTGRSVSTGNNTSTREEMDFRLQPLVFQQLRPAGPPHYSAQAVIYASGHRFANGLPFTGATFPQYLPGMRPGARGRR